VLLILINMNITGKEAEELLECAGYLDNKIHNNQRSEWCQCHQRYPARTPAMTTSGFKEEEIARVVEAIALILDNPADSAAVEKAKKIVRELCEAYPLYQ